MQQTDEIFDVVNEQDEVIGQATRREVHKRGLRHRAIHVLLFNPGGELFVQKRSATKDTFPLCYDSSVSGHLDSGETYDACASRELREELGLDVPAQGLTRCFKIAACPETGWEFVWAYRLCGDYRPQINREEIESGCFWSLAQIEHMVAEQPELCARSFVRIFREFRQRDG